MESKMNKTLALTRSHASDIPLVVLRKFKFIFLVVKKKGKNNV